MTTAFRTLPFALFVLMIALPAWAQDAKEAPKDTLTEDIDRILGHKKLKGVRASVHVRDLSTGKTLYERKPDLQLNPASNAKIITAAAVLDRFGPSKTFTTELWGNRAKGGVMQGDMVIVGGGDPFLLWSHLLEMAERAQRKGIKTVEGDLVVVDGIFDGEVMPPAFAQKGEEAAYRTTVSGLSAEFSAMTIIVRPTTAGKKPVISFDPPNSYALIDNKAVTVETNKEASKSPLSVRLAKGDGTTRVIVRGNTRKGATVRRRVDFPGMYAGHLMKSALKKLGIEVKGKVRLGTGPRPEGMRLLSKHRSYTLTYLALAMQKWSNNFMAEMLFKSLDAGSDPATWAGAQARATAFLKKAGIKEGSYKCTNGSGLYDANRYSARQMTQILAYLQTRPDILPDFETTLAIAGVDGTLGRRMRGTAGAKIVRGKTGTLNGVVTLTGYVQKKDGRKLAFSILFNGTKGPARDYRAIQDKIGTRLAH